MAALGLIRSGTDNTRISSTLGRPSPVRSNTGNIVSRNGRGRYGIIADFLQRQRVPASPAICRESDWITPEYTDSCLTDLPQNLLTPSPGSLVVAFHACRDRMMSSSAGQGEEISWLNPLFPGYICWQFFESSLPTWKGKTDGRRSTQQKQSH